MRCAHVCVCVCVCVCVYCARVVHIARVFCPLATTRRASKQQHYISTLGGAPQEAVRLVDGDVHTDIVERKLMLDAVAMLLPCCCHAIAMLLPCYCHAIAMLMPCYCCAMQRRRFPSSGDPPHYSTVTRADTLMVKSTALALWSEKCISKYLA